MMMCFGYFDDRHPVAGQCTHIDQIFIGEPLAQHTANNARRAGQPGIHRRIISYPVEILKQKHPPVEVLMLTGHPTVRSAIEAMQYAAFDNLTKPCELEDLLTKAESAAARKKERQDQIHLIQTKPYISDREREALIAKVLNA